MGLLLLFLFIAVPLAEIGVFIQVGGEIGVLSTILAIVLTAMIGTALLRFQGLRTLDRLRQQMDAGQTPTRELFDGACLLFAGALLLVPGFVTDGIGLLLFVPPLRGLLYRWLARRVEVHGLKGNFRQRPGGRGPIIDGEFEDISDDDPEGGDGDRRLPR